jgi:hypothetical protein
MDSRRVVVNCREFAFRITSGTSLSDSEKTGVPIGCGARGSQVRRAGFYDPKSAGLYRPTRCELRGRRHQIGRGAFSLSAFGA